MARQVVSERPVYTDDRVEARSVRKNIQLSKVQRLVYTIAGLINGLLAIRFVFSLLGANPQNSIADFIYTITDPLVSPFRGLFNVTNQLGTARFEVETLIAIIFYSLIAWVIVRLLGVGKDVPEDTV